MTRFLAGLILGLFFATSALAQSGASVKQSGSSVSPNTVPYWVTNGAIGDSVTSADSPVTSFGVTSAGQLGICDNTARSSSSGWIGLCMGYIAGVPTISVQNYGTATAQPLQFVVNGTTYAFPGSLTNITIGTTPVIGGTNSQCLFVSAGVVGQQACTLSAITALTGDATATGPGSSALTLATVNANTGTFGSGGVVPIITVNGKGLITAVSTSPVSMTVGSSAIVSGTTDTLLYDNGGVLGSLATLGSAVLSTNVSGVPAWSTSLPSGITIPGPTFSGTVTFPDTATWTNTGITHAAAISVGSATLPAGGIVNVSSQYQVNGSQIAASNLSNGTTGTGAVVLAASPTLSGTVGGSVTMSGALTLSGNDTFTAQAIFQGASAPASAAGNSVVMGTILAPTLTNTAQAFLYNTAANGAVVEGDGSTYDVVLANKSGGVALGVGTGTTVPVLPGLAAGTCSSGLALDASNNVIKASCPGAAASIQVGLTTITSGTSGQILYDNAGVLGNTAITAGTGISVSGTANATIATNLSAGTGISITGTAPQTIATSLSSLTASLSGNVSLNNTGLYFDGPSVAQGVSGTWFASGNVQLQDSSAVANIACKLWDGTTVFDSIRLTLPAIGFSETAHLSGVIASPAGNIRISCQDTSATTGQISFNTSGNSKDSTITAVRIQ